MMTKDQLNAALSDYKRRFDQLTLRQKNGVLALVVLSVLVVSVGLLKLTANKPAHIKSAHSGIPVSTLATKREKLSPTIELLGTTHSAQITTLSSPVTAYVSAVNALEGAHHRTGETLIQLDQQDALLTLNARKAEIKEIEGKIAAEHTRHLSNQRSLTLETALLKIAERRVERFNNLTSKQAAAEQQKDDALSNRYQQALKVEQVQLEINAFDARLSQLESALMRAEANAHQAELDADRLTLKSPFDSRIVAVNVSPGNRLNTGDPVIKLYNIDSLEAHAQVPDHWLNHLRSLLHAHGPPVPIRATAVIDDTSLSLSLSRLAGSASQQAGGVMAIFDIESPPYWLEIERALKIQLRLPPIDNVIALPESALHDRNRIYRVVDGALQGHTITRVGTYIREDGSRQALIRTDDLSEGDLIMTTNLPNAMTGIPVHVQ